MRSLALLLALSAVPAAAQSARVYTPDTPPAANETTTILNTTVVSVDAAARTLTVRADEARDGVVDRQRTRVLRVSEGAAAALRDLAPGATILLTLKGGLVADIKLSVPAGTAPGSGTRPRSGAVRRGAAGSTPAGGARGGVTGGVTGGVLIVSPAPGASPAPPPAAGGPQGRPVPQLPGGARTPQNRTVPQLPAGTTDPRARTLPQVPLVPTASPSPAVSPVSPSPRPAISPVSQSPRPAISPVSGPSPRSPGTPRPVVLPSDPPPTPLPSALPDR